MALTADLKRARVQAVGLMSQEIVNASVIFGGSYLAGCSRDHATAANRGRVKAFAGAVGEIPLGFSQIGQTGNTSATPPEEARINEEPVYYDVAVTGLAGDVTDVYRLVYATDDATFTFTRPTRAVPVGIVTRWKSASLARVRFFSFAEMALCSMGGAAQDLLFIGHVMPIASGSYLLGTNSTGLVMPYKGRFTDFYAITVRACTDVDVSIDATLKINDVATTGGVVQLRFGDAVAAKKSGTAITALNSFSEGDTVQVGSTVNTAGTATDPGGWNLYAKVLREPGL